MCSVPLCGGSSNYPLPVQVVGEINGDHDTGRGGVDTHVVCGIVEELGSRVALYIVAVVVPPTQLHVHPVLLGRRGIHYISTCVCGEGGDEKHNPYLIQNNENARAGETE